MGNDPNKPNAAIASRFMAAHGFRLLRCTALVGASVAWGFEAPGIVEGYVKDGVTFFEALPGMYISFGRSITLGAVEGLKYGGILLASSCAALHTWESISKQHTCDAVEPPLPIENERGGVA